MRSDIRIRDNEICSIRVQKIARPDLHDGIDALPSFSRFVSPVTQQPDRSPSCGFHAWKCEVAVSRLSSDGGRASEERFSFEDLWIFGKMKRGDVQSLSLLDGDICRHVS